MEHDPATGLRPGGLLRSASPSERALRALRGWIEQGRLPAGGRLPAEAALAATLGVSRTSLRRALATLTAAGLIEQRGAHRVVAGRLASAQRRRRRAIAVFAPTPLVGLQTGQGSHGYDVHIQLGAVQALGERGCHVLLCPAGSGVPELGPALAGQLAGAIALGAAAAGPTRDLLTDLARDGIPTAVQADAAPGGPFDSVASDHAAGAGLLIDWLAAHGARRILRLWELPPGAVSPAWLVRRDEGARRALLAHGLEAGPALIVSQPDDPVDGHNRRGFAARRARLRAAARDALATADAVLCISDGQAFHVHAALADLGRRPGVDVLVAGYDAYFADSVYRDLNPGPALSVDKDCPALGAALADLLLQRLDGALPPEPQQHLVQPTLVVREELVRGYRPRA